MELQAGATTHTLTISPSSNRLMSTTGLAPAKSNTYDNAGNLLSDGTIQYTYSPRGRLVKVTNGSTIVQSRYNALGQRVEKSNGDVFVYDEEGHLIGEYSKSTGRMLREIVYLGDEPVALLTQTVTGTAPSQVFTPNVFYIFSDHLGTPRVITQASDNAIRWRWDEADPFGLQPPNENPSGKGALTFNLRMPGQFYDRESNLFYNYHRDYDPQLGRYVQSDPIGLDGGSNTYDYTGGNPLVRKDALGLSWVCQGFVPFRVCRYVHSPALPPLESSLPPPGLPFDPTKGPADRKDCPDKDLCDKWYEDDVQSCHDRYGNGLKGATFRSMLNGCLQHAATPQGSMLSWRARSGPLD